MKICDIKPGDLVVYDGAQKRVAVVAEANDECCLVDPATGDGGTWVSPLNLSPAPAQEDDQGRAPSADQVVAFLETRVAALEDERASLSSLVADLKAEAEQLRRRASELTEERDRLTSALEARANTKENENAEGQQQGEGTEGPRGGGEAGAPGGAGGSQGA